MPARAHAHEGLETKYGGGELGLVTSHNARPAWARPATGFVDATADCLQAHRGALDGGPPGQGPASNQRESVQSWLS